MSTSNANAQRNSATRAEIESALQAHGRYVRRQPNGNRAQFRRRNLSGVDLSDCDLTEADFTGAMLCGANLKFGNFQRANFYCADLRNVDGRCVNFVHADMRGAKLTDSDFSSAKLDHADFRAGRLAELNEQGEFEIIDLSGSAENVDFSFCSLRGASFDDANLRGANLTGALLQGTSFKGTKLADVKFEGAVLIDVNLKDLQVPGSALKGCVFPPSADSTAKVPHLLARLDAHKRWIETGAQKGTSAILDNEDLRPLQASIGKFQLTAISARGANAVGMDFSSMQLQGADFEGADLRDTNFEGADLRGINFRNANLGHARFAAADLTSLQLNTGTRLTDFTGAKFTSKQLEEALVDANWKQP